MSDYRCSVCNENTISMTVTWDVPGNSYDEAMYHTYTCEKCESEGSVLASEDSYREGEMVDMT